MRRLPAVAAVALLAVLTAGALLASPAGPDAAAGADRIVADLDGVDPGTSAGPATGASPDGGAHAGRQRDGTGTGRSDGERNASEPSDGQRNASAANETASPGPAAIREAMIESDRLVAPCAAEPPGWHAATTNESRRVADWTATRNWTKRGYWRTENRTLVRNATGPPANASVVGRVGGTWYDERLSISDPENVSERALDRLVERTAARVEALRCLDFESAPRVQVVGRSTMAARQQIELSSRSPDRNSFDDARLEAALLVPTEVDPTAARLRTRTGAVRASYDPEYDVVTLLAPTDQNGTVDAAALDEATLAHELVHALQDQRFDLSRFDSHRTDRALAEGALVEGDAIVLKRWYESRCGSDGWTEPCLDATPPPSDANPDPGLHLLLFQPYNDGPGVVERTFERDGWHAVDALYEDPPKSAAEVLFPTAYEDYEPEQLSVPVTSGGGWELLRPEGGPTTDALGPATVAATLMSPTFESGVDPIYTPQSLQQTGTRVGLDRYQTYDYRVDAARDWSGDRLIAYQRDDGEVASVWRSRWASRDDATLFERRYAELLDRRDAAAHDRLPGVYQFRDASRFAGAVYVDADGRSVTIVHGPDLEALRALHPDVPRPRSSGRERTEPASSQPAEGPGDALPGLTALGSLFAVLVAIAVRGRAGEE